MLNNRTRWILKGIIFIFCFTLIIHRWQQVSMYDAGYGKSWYYGDAFSNRNVISAATFFKDSGFTKTSFLPAFDYKTPYPNGYGEAMVYTHYPALPDIIAGISAVAFNTTNRHTLAIIPLLLSLLTFFLIYRFLSAIIPDPNAAFISASLLVLSNYYIAWADDLHQHVYVEFFKWLMFYLLHRYYENGNKPWYYLPLIALIYLVESNLSFEPIIFTGIVVLGFSWIYRRSFFTKEVFILLMMPVAGFAIHMYQNYHYFGSWDKVYEDMRQAFILRTNGKVGELDHWSERPVGFAEIPWIIWLWLQRFGHFFLLPASFFVMICVLALKKLKSTDRKLFGIAIVFLVAGISWNFIMIRHALIHMFTLRHMGIFFGIVAGIGLYAYKDLLVDLWNRKKRGWLIFHFCFLYYTLILMAINHIYFLYLKYGFAYPYLGVWEREWEVSKLLF